jgi:flavin reductase (DIM6/NTAB) family NADH-FMN oxidoreductase RutF
VNDGFDEVVARMDSAMVIVTTSVGPKRSGCLVGFHSQCSIDPPRYAVWISKQNHTFGLLDGASHLAVHLLEESNQSLAELFGTTTGDRVDKFSACESSRGPGGVPVLDDVVNRFVGRKVSVTDEGGDHVCVVLEAVTAQVGPAGATVLRLSDEVDLDPGHQA